MPLKRTPLSNNNKNANEVEIQPGPMQTSTVTRTPSCYYDTLAPADTPLNRTSSDTELPRLTPPNFVSQRNKKRKVKMGDSISTPMDDIKEEMRTLMNEFITSQANELKKVNTTLKELQQINHSIESSVTFLTAQDEDFKQRLIELEAKVQQDRSYITILENKLEEMELRLRKSSFEIKNVPKITNENKEDLIEMVSNLSKSIGCNIAQSDISDILRVRSKSAKNKNPPIIVETKSTLLKNAILKSAKWFNIKHKSKLCAKHLGLKTQEDTPIYISEHLTTKGARLHFLARDLVKAKNYKFCWTAYGKIYVRENENSSIVLIKNEQHIHQLMNDQSQGSQEI